MQSIEDFKSVIESLPHGVLVLDHDGNVILFNSKFTQLLGVAPQSIQEQKAGLELCRSDLLYLKDGRVIERTSAPYQTAKGIGGQVVSFQDVTEKVRTQNALEKSELRFRTIFESAPMAVATIDLRDGSISPNPTLCQMTGYTHAEIEALGFQGLTHPEDLPDELILFSQLIEGQIDRYEREKRYIRKDGSVFWGRLVVSLGRNERGEALVGIGMAEDITEHKAMIEALKRNEEKYRTLYRHTPIMMHSIGANRQILSVSDYWLESTGYRVEEVLGKPLVDFMTPTSREQVLKNKLFDDFVATGSLKNLEFQLVKKSGEIIDVLLSAIAEYDEKRAFVRSLSVLVDITERNRLLRNERAARIEAIKAVQQRDDFITLASHELRTPITPLKLHLKFIIRHLQRGLFANSPRSADFLKLLFTADQQLDRLARLVEDLLSESRIKSGKLLLNRVPIDLSKVITQTVLKNEIEAKPPLVLHIDPKIHGEFDPVLIEQVVVNLVSNAVKYGRGKPIEITLNESDGKAVLSVRDFGIGISAKDQVRIFERFERAVSMTEFGGFGLGLYITRKIVSAHHGTIRVESEPDRGACFIVELPLRQSTSETGNPEVA